MDATNLHPTPSAMAPDGSAHGSASLTIGQILLSFGVPTFMLAFAAPLHSRLLWAATYLSVVVGCIAIAMILRGERHRHHLSRCWGVMLVTSWVWWTLVMMLVGFGTHNVAFALLWVPTILLVGVVLIGHLIAKWRQGVICVAIIGFGLTLAAVSDGYSTKIKEFQVRIDESYLLEHHEESRLTVPEGMRLWFWLPGLLEGGGGVVLDPSHGLSGPEFARMMWYETTYAPGSCTLLYDDWYWCDCDQPCTVDH